MSELFPLPIPLEQHVTAKVTYIRNLDYSSRDPIIEALEVVRDAARARRVGRVAVLVAVSFAPRPRHFSQLARHWLALLEPPPGA